MRKNFQILLATVLLMSSAICAAAEINSGYIEAEGIIYYEGGMSPNQMRRMAILDAYRYLAEETNTLYVSGNSTVKNLRELDETVNAKVEAALNGAKVVSVTRDADGSFHAIVRLPVYGGSQSLAGAVLGASIELEDFPKPIVRNIHSEVYSGLIIDCRGLNLSQAIAPTIKSADGTKIYAYNNVGYSAASGNGMVEYSSDLNSTRAGSSPLVIKATKVSDACDVVVSSEDSDKILNANQIAKFLDNCLVVFVR